MGSNPTAHRQVYESMMGRLWYKLERHNKVIAQNFRCKYCNCIITFATATLDHVDPKDKKLGNHYGDATVAACVECNRKKADKSPEVLKDPLLELVKKFELELRKRSYIACWKLSLDTKGSFKKWLKFHQINL